MPKTVTITFSHATSTPLIVKAFFSGNAGLKVSAVVP